MSRRLDGKRRIDYNPLNGFVNTLWHNINQHTVNGLRPCLHAKSKSYFVRGTKVLFTRDELYKWCASQWPLIQGMKSVGKRPSLDRINNDGHYELNNIRIIELGQNSAQGGATVAARKTKKLNELPPRFCVYCTVQLTRKERDEDSQRETEPHFLKRKHCGRSCALSHRNKTNYSRWKNHVKKV